MDNYIKKLVRESLLNENYGTAKELKKLATEALKYWCKIWLDKRQVDINVDVYTINFIDFNDFNGYDILGEFLHNTAIKIGFSNTLKAGGVCKTKNRYEHDIELRMTPKEMEDIQEEMEFHIGDSEGSESSFAYWATNRYVTVLVHELQHAYDGWRSKLNFANKQRGLEYGLKKFKSDRAQEKPREEWTDQELKDVITHQRAYLRLDHEIAARFVQTVANMVVWELTKVDGKRGRGIKPWKDFEYDFRRKFMGWDEMTGPQKKSLRRKLAKVYYDGIEDFNEQLKNKK